MAVRDLEQSEPHHPAALHANAAVYQPLLMEVVQGASCVLARELKNGSVFAFSQVRRHRRIIPSGCSGNMAAT